MIVFIHHSVNPYRVAFFNALHKAGVPFKVYFLSSPAKNRRWKASDFELNFPYIFLAGTKIYVPGNDHSYFQLNWDVLAFLKQDQPSTVITIGWNYSAAFLSAWFCKKNNIPFIVWSESTQYERSLQRTLTKSLVKWLLRQTKYCIAAGTRAKEYLISLGVNQAKIVTAYYSVDSKKFIQRANTISKKQSDALRASLQYVPDDIIFAFVGQFVHRKGIKQLMAIASQLQKNTHIKFLLIGYGPLQQYIEEVNLPNVQCVSFVKNDQIIEYLRAVDVLILPSLEETWGLVVNEAMCAGKPVLVSKYAGSSEDLVQQGKNGYSIDPLNIKNCINCIQELANNEQLRKKMGEKSLQIIKHVSIEQNIEIIKLMNE